MHKQFNAYDDYTGLRDAHNNLNLNVSADQAEHDSTDISNRKDTTQFKVQYFSGSALVLVTQTSSPSIHPHLYNLREGWLSLS